MKPDPRIRATSGLQLLSAALIAAVLALPAPALAQVELATSPMATSTTSAVKPNLMFVLDDSGSMDWDYLPDDRPTGSSAELQLWLQRPAQQPVQRQVYYNPAITYSPPVICG